MTELNTRPKILALVTGDYHYVKESNRHTKSLNKHRKFKQPKFVWALKKLLPNTIVFGDKFDGESITHHKEVV